MTANSALVAKLRELLAALSDTTTIVHRGDWSGTAHEAAYSDLRDLGPDLAREYLSLFDRLKTLELMVADHPMVPARDPELNKLLDQASRTRNGRTRRAADWDRHEPIERAIRKCLIETEALGAHRLLTDTVVLLERAQQRVAAWIDLGKPDNSARASLGDK